LDSIRASGKSGADLLNAARQATRRRDFQQAEELLTAAKTKSHEERDTLTEASARAMLAAFRFDTEGVKGARPEAEEALRLARLAGSPATEVEALYMLGCCAVAESRVVDAFRLFEELLPVAEKHSTPERVRLIRSHFAALALRVGDMSRAATHVRTLVRGADDPDADLEHAKALLAQGEIANRLGRTAEARKHFEEARLLCHRLRDVPGEAIALMSLGDMMMYEKELDMAEAYIQAAREAFQQQGMRGGEANCLLSLGEIAYRKDDPAKARDIFTRTLALFREVGDRQGEANSILKLGDLSREPPEDETLARQHFTSALEIYSELHDPFSMGRALRRLGEVAPTREEAVARWEEAIRLFEQAGRADLIQEVREDMKTGLDGFDTETADEDAPPGGAPG
jgi:tetratricopeptide (TPR) repeat protein